MALVTGTSLGPYQIVEQIGAGGMGEVYRARDGRLGRDVAIKALPAAYADDPVRLARFEREARLLASLNHPNIAGIHGIEEVEGRWYLVLEFVDGITLDARLRQGPMPPDEAIEVCRQIASGVETAHETGVVHRDLKPGNVILTPDGRVKVLDFGLATQGADTAGAENANLSGSPTVHHLTREGLLLGTVVYMSPEQARGRIVDKRTDIWSFGCVLYECLAGRPPFEGETVSDLVARILEREPDWSRLPSSTPHRVRDLLKRCLRKNPKQRLRDIGDARLALEESEADDAPGPVSKNAEFRRRLSGIVAWSIAAAAVLIAAAVFFDRPSGVADAGPTAMRFSAVTTFSGVETQPSLSPDGRSVVFVSNHGGQWDLYVSLVAGGNVVRLTDTPEIETGPRWSPDGTRILFARMNDRGLQDLWIMSALGGTPRRVVTDGAQPAWSPDGRSIAYVSDGRIWICDATGERPRAVTSSELPLVHNQPAFSNDARSLVFVRRAAGPYGELAVVELETGRVRHLTRDGALAWSPAWSPDGRFIYFTSSRGGTMNVWKLPSASGSPERITAGQGADMEIDLSKDGTRLVYSSFRSNVNLAEVSLAPETLGRQKWLTGDAARGEFAPCYSPDGRHIAYFSNRTGAEREAIWVMEVNGDNPVKLVDDDFVSVFPRWTAGGRQIVYAARMTELDAPGNLRQVPLAGGAPQELPIRPWRSVWGDVSSDGRLIYQTSKSTGELYDPQTGQRHPIANLPGEPFWSRDGRSIAYIVRPNTGRESEDGLWVGEPEGPRRQVFHGWVIWFAWTGNDEMLVVEGKPDFKGTLWRVDLRGRREQVLPEVGIFRRDHEAIYSPIRFDVHPDGRRIVIEALEFQESDIGLIDNVR